MNIGSTAQRRNCRRTSSRRDYQIRNVNSDAHYKFTPERDSTKHRLRPKRAIGYNSRVHIVGRVILKRDRDGPVRDGNPWIFSQAIAKKQPTELAAGDGVEVFDFGGKRVTE